MPSGGSRRESRGSITAALFGTDEGIVEELPQDNGNVIQDVDGHETYLLPHAGIVIKLKTSSKLRKNVNIYVNLCSSSHRCLESSVADTRDTGNNSSSNSNSNSNSDPNWIILAGPCRIRKDGKCVNHIYDVIIHEDEFCAVVTRKQIGSVIIPDMPKLREVRFCCLVLCVLLWQFHSFSSCFVNLLFLFYPLFNSFLGLLPLYSRAQS